MLLLRLLRRTYLTAAMRESSPSLHAAATCVCPPVSLQLVAPGEPLATEDPVAHKGPLASVPAQMGPQVGRLAVHLAASLHVTDVLLLLRRVPTVPGTHTVITSESRKTWKNIRTDHNGNLFSPFFLESACCSFCCDLPSSSS